MKTETQTAKENIQKIKKLELPPMNQANISGMIIEHKASCQRFLEFLEDVELYFGNFEYHKTGMKFEKLIKEKITDLKQAIKLYEDNGI